MSSDVLLQTIDNLTQDVVQRDLTIKALRLTIEKLKMELTHLKRMRYGRSSEKVEAAQIQLELLSAALAPLLPVIAPAVDGSGNNVADLDAERKKRSKKSNQPEQGLPAHLPREDVVHSGCAEYCKCGSCGTGLQQIGQDVSEVLDYVPGSFKVIRHIRPKFVCSQCHMITQEAAPSRPINPVRLGGRLRQFAGATGRQPAQIRSECLQGSHRRHPGAGSESRAGQDKNRTTMGVCPR